MLFLCHDINVVLSVRIYVGTTVTCKAFTATDEIFEYTYY